MSESATTGTRVIDRISEGGPTLEGQRVEFDLCFTDGTIDSLQCSYERLPRVVHCLKQLGEMAEHLRHKGTGPSAEVASPYRVVGVKTGSNIDRSLIVLELRTQEGIPLLVAMETSIAESMVVALRTTLAKPQVRFDPRS